MPEQSDSNTARTIFLIEDDDDTRLHLKKNLRGQGYRVLVAADVEDALEWMRATHIPADLMLIDLVGKSPNEVLRAGREIRSHSKYDGHTPLIVVPEIIPEELEGTDENVDGNDWICYYDDADQLRSLILRLTGKDSTQKP